MQSEKTTIVEQVAKVIHSAISKLSFDGVIEEFTLRFTREIGSDNQRKPGVVCKYPIWRLRHIPLTHWNPFERTTSKDESFLRRNWAKNFTYLDKDPDHSETVSIYKGEVTGMPEFSIYWAKQKLSREDADVLYDGFQHIKESYNIKSDEASEKVSIAANDYQEQLRILDSKYGGENQKPKSDMAYTIEREKIDTLYDSVCNEYKRIQIISIYTAYVLNDISHRMRNALQLIQSVKFHSLVDVHLPFSKALVEKLGPEKYDKLKRLLKSYCNAHYVRYGNITQSSFQEVCFLRFIENGSLTSSVTNVYVKSLRKSKKDADRTLFHILRFYLKPKPKKESKGRTYSLVDITPPSQKAYKRDTSVSSDSRNEDTYNIYDPLRTLDDVPYDEELSKIEDMELKIPIPPLVPSRKTAPSGNKLEDKKKVKSSSVQKVKPSVRKIVKTSVVPKDDKKVSSEMRLEAPKVSKTQIEKASQSSNHNIRDTKPPLPQSKESSISPKDENPWEKVTVTLDSGEKILVSRHALQEQLNVLSQASDRKQGKFVEISKETPKGVRKSIHEGERLSKESIHESESSKDEEKGESTLDAKSKEGKSSDLSVSPDITTISFAALSKFNITLKPGVGLAPKAILKWYQSGSDIYLYENDSVTEDTGFFELVYNRNVVKKQEELLKVFSSVEEKIQKDEVEKTSKQPTIYDARPSGESRKSFYRMSDDDEDKLLRLIPKEYLDQSKSGTLRLKPIVYKMYSLYGVDKSLEKVSTISKDELLKQVNTDFNKQSRQVKKPSFSNLWAGIKNKYKGVSLCSNPTSKREQAFLKEYRDLKNTIIQQKGPVSVLPALKKKQGKRSSGGPSTGKPGGNNTQQGGKSLISPDLIATLEILRSLRSFTN